MGLRVQLVIEAGVCAAERICVRKSMCLQIVGHLLHLLLQARRRGRQVCPHGGLVKVAAAFGSRRNKCNAETAAPSCERSLSGMKLCCSWFGLSCEYVMTDSGTKKEGIAKPLQCAGPCIVVVIGIEIEVAIVKERNAYHQHRAEQQNARMHNPPLHQLRPPPEPAA